MISAAPGTTHEPLGIQHQFDPAFIGMDARAKIPVSHRASQHQHSHRWPPGPVTEKQQTRRDIVPAATSILVRSCNSSAVRRKYALRMGATF
jgi:hypothetical protein